VDRSLLDVVREVEGSAALQVRLRVGVREGRASIEKGSTVRTVTEDGVGFLVSRLTLVSHVTVVEISDGMAAVNSIEFARAIRRLFRPYVGMALIATGRDF
jgi:hypothetical protein